MITRDLKVGDKIEYWMNADDSINHGTEPVWKSVGKVVRLEEPRMAVISEYNGPIIYKFPDGTYNKLHRIACDHVPRIETSIYADDGTEEGFRCHGKRCECGKEWICI